MGSVKVKKREFTCYSCERTFNTIGTEKERDDEAVNNFGKEYIENADEDELCVLCDNCHAIQMKLMFN